MISMAFLALLAMHRTTSALPVLSSTSVLQRRVNPGSYAIITPEEKAILYDPQYDVYFTFFKFGDGKEFRYEAYDTHNPSFIYTYAPSDSRGEGSQMADLTLGKLVRKYRDTTHAVEWGLNSNNHQTEWFRMYLGKDKVVAMKSKAVLHKLATKYGEADLSSKAKREEFAAQFVTELEAILTPKDQSKAASQDETSDKKASKDSITATDASSKTSADTPPKKDDVGKVAGKPETKAGVSSEKKDDAKSPDGAEAKRPSPDTKAKPSMPKVEVKQPKQPGGTGRITRARTGVGAKDKEKQT